MKWEERPIWYDAYVKQPPFEDPVWNIKMPKQGTEVRKLFYLEDLERASVYYFTLQIIRLRNYYLIIVVM